MVVADATVLTLQQKRRRNAKTNDIKASDFAETAKLPAFFAHTAQLPRFRSGGGRLATQPHRMASSFGESSFPSKLIKMNTLNSLLWEDLKAFFRPDAAGTANAYAP